jgi:DNA-binding transcriptional MerR regulator
MPLLVGGEVYYRTNEACRMSNISRSTLLRWVRSGIVKDTPYRDRRGWRLFSAAEIEILKSEANRIC